MNKLNLNKKSDYSANKKKFNSQTTYIQIPDKLVSCPFNFWGFQWLYQFSVIVCVSEDNCANLQLKGETGCCNSV